MVNKELLDKIIRKSDICKFECTFDDISGVPVKYNEKYIMVNIYEDFQFDGFCIFDITEIENICYDETYEFINHRCKEEKIYPSKAENINIENFINVFNYFKDNEENIIVECGEYDDEDYSFSIGKVEKVTEKYIEIKYFDYMAKWDEDEFDMVYYDDISVVSFGKRYIKYMSKYTH